MDLTKEAIDTLVGLAEPSTYTIDNVNYSSEKLTLVAPPVPTHLLVGTLDGFVNLLETSFEGFDPTKVIIHVDSHDSAKLIAAQSDRYGRRQVWIEAKALKGDRSFNFGSFYPVEEFVISVSSLFVQDESLAKLLSLAGNITAGEQAQVQDDGISQKVTMKAGVSFVETAVLNPRVTLAPYRTFREIEQPTSDFVFRVNTSKGITCALFEADGGFWKIEAINKVKGYLSNKLKTEKLADIPIIA